jgi:hypothetical protein
MRGAMVGNVPDYWRIASPSPKAALADEQAGRFSAEAVIGMIHKLRSFPNPKRSLIAAQVCEAPDYSHICWISSID